MSSPAVAFRLVLPSAPWLSCLSELRSMYSDALRRAGYAVTLSDVYDINPYEVNVAFGAHAVTPPPGCVVMQSEHHARHFTLDYLRVLEHARLVVNMGPFDTRPEPGYTQATIVEVPPGVMPLEAAANHSALHTFAAALGDDTGRDLDCVFYGSVTPRRARILESLTAAGIHVTALYGSLGAERDRYIDRAKVVLDLKQDGDEPPDSTRVFWSLSRGACTLSENAPRGLLAHITPESVVSAVQICLGPDGEAWRRRCREQYAQALGPCDVTPLLTALGLT